MKLLSVAIPCYNSEAYMANCIESLLVGGEEDGGRDGPGLHIDDTLDVPSGGTAAVVAHAVHVQKA